MNIKIKFKIVICILCVGANLIPKDTQSMLPNVQEPSDDILFQTLLTFTKLKVQLNQDYVAKTVFVGTFCENIENIVYQSDVINALLKIYQQSYYQFVLSDQFHISNEIFKGRISFWFIDGINAML